MPCVLQWSFSLYYSCHLPEIGLELIIETCSQLKDCGIKESEIGMELPYWGELVSLALRYFL